MAEPVEAADTLPEEPLLGDLDLAGDLFHIGRCAQSNSELLVSWTHLASWNVAQRDSCPASFSPKQKNVTDLLTFQSSFMSPSQHSLWMSQATTTTIALAWVAGVCVPMLPGMAELIAMLHHVIECVHLAMGGLTKAS